MAGIGLVAALLMTLAPTPALAQQDTARARAAGDTLQADTTAQDTVLTPRQRAMQRLRALPLNPVQPDTTDTLSADSLAADSARADSLAGRVPPPVVVPDSLQIDTTRLRPQPPDTGPRLPSPELPPGMPRLPGDTLGPPGRRGPPGRPGALGAGGAQGAQGARAEDRGPIGSAEVLEQLRSLSGYVATEYQGQGAVFEADSNRLRITGDSRIAREGNTLETDSLLVWNGESGVVCGYGQPVLSGESDPVESTRVCFDIERDVGMAEGARTRFSQGATWYVRGANNRVYVLTGVEHSTLYGQRAEFTSCDLEDPHYTFEARSLKMVENEWMVARDVTLKFEDVPVFWLPWMVSSMKRGRRSGLLMPQFGVNDIVRNSTEYNRHISNLGFYWAMSDYASARGTFEWFANNWTAVEGALTYYWRRQFLQGSLNAKHYWRQREGEPAGRELTLNTNNSWQPDERTRINLNANYASSTDFVRRNSFDPQELNRSIRSAASVNRSFDWGSMTLGADRRQQLSNDQVDMTLPSLQLSLSPMTLYSNDEGFSITWSGSGNATRTTRNVQEDLGTGRDSRTLNSSISHRLSVGKLSLSQNLSYRDETLGAQLPRSTPIPVIQDGQLVLQGSSAPGLLDETTQTMDWSTSVGYQQNLWVGTSLSPNISVSGTQVRDDSTRFWRDSLGVGSPGEFVAQPLRISAGASLTTAIYGFWPGFANFSRIRHKIAPTLRWSYSPQPTTSALQDSVFGIRNLREQNRLTLSFSQTFEAKVESDDTAAADTVELGQPGEPRRLPQAKKITLLAINTGTSFVYDFVAAKEDGRGFMPSGDQVSNSIRSDLLDGLQLSMTHDLFEEGERPADGGVAPRTFKPFLTRLSASFSIDNNFWLFRTLGLSAGESEPEEQPDTAQLERGGMEQPVGAEAQEESVAGVGSVVPRGNADTRRGLDRQGVGRWTASLSYSLQRSRPTPGSTNTGNQMLQANISFDPTEHWSVRWSTAYNFTDHEFANHYLTLSRDLHRWQANFDFIKAQNGNFALQFRVQLLDQEDLKLDYDQQQRAEGAPGLPSRRTSN